MNASWYDVLAVEPTATTDEIRDAWRAAVADLDPTDRRFRVLNQAAAVLLDPDDRAAYDAELELVPPDAAEPQPTDRSEIDASALAKTPSRAPRRPVPGWLLVAAAAVTAAALTWVGLLSAKPSDAAVESDTTAAQAAAEQAIVPILTYNAHHLGDSAAAAHQYMTDDERRQYDQLFTVIRQNAPRTGTVVRAKYVASGVVRSGAGRVDVLVFVDQATTNKQHPNKPVIYKNEATVSMEKVGDDWLVDNLVTGTHGS